MCNTLERRQTSGPGRCASRTRPLQAGAVGGERAGWAQAVTLCAFALETVTKPASLFGIWRRP